MDESLDILSGPVQEEPTSMAIFQPEVVSTNLPPMAAIKTRAASIALLSGNASNAVEQYQSMVVDGQAGSDSIAGGLLKQTNKSFGEQDLQSVMLLLGDKNVSLETKKSVVKSFHDNKFLKEPTVQLMSANLANASEGESEDNEKARLTNTDILKQVYESNQQIQGLVNAYVSSKDWKNGTTLADTVALIAAPFGNNISVARGTEAERKGTESIWKTVKSFIMPGSETMKIREQFQNMPFDKREEFTKKLLSSISQNSGVIFSSENQFAQMQRAAQIFTPEGYSKTDEWIDNITGLLDVVGLGGIIRGATKASKTKKMLDSMVDPTLAEKGTVEPSKASGSVFVAKDSPKDNIFTFPQAAVQKLQDEHLKLKARKAELKDLVPTRTLNSEIKGLKESLIPSATSDVKELAQSLRAEYDMPLKDAVAAAKTQITEHNDFITSSISQLEKKLSDNSEALSVNKRLQNIEKEINSLNKGVGEIPFEKNPIADLVRRIELRSITHTHNPASPAAIIQQSNPAKARDIFETVYRSTEDSVASALYGTTRAEAIAGDVFPQLTTEAGRVLTKPVDMQRNLYSKLEPDDDIRKFLESNNGYQYTPKERENIVSNKTNDFKNASGLHLHENMSSFNLDGEMWKVDAVYGTPEGSFSNAEEAIKQATHALRNAGVLPEEITILKKDGLDHVPTSLDEVRGVEGNYLIRVTQRAEVSPADITSFSSLDVKKNFLDRFPGTMSKDSGTLSMKLFDPGSMFDKQIVGSASIADDKASGFEKLLLSKASQASDSYMSLDKGQRKLVDNYIREANEKGLKTDVADLTARGFNPTAIDTVLKWNKYWDGVFYLENLDVVRTLKAQGYQKLISPALDVYARPLGSYQNVHTMVDPTSGNVVTSAAFDLKDLYAKNGYVATLRRPVQINGETVEHVIVRNNPNEYTRAVRDNDSILNYRDGYYQVRYKGARFVDEIDVDGKRKAVAVAGDTAEAERFADRMRGQNSAMRYEVRGDDRAMKNGSDDWFDVNSASGRIAQRHRGVLLEDATGINVLGEGSHVVAPIDSAIIAARSIAGRSMGRTTIETARARFLEQYKDVLPKNNIGGVDYPRGFDDIGVKGGQFSEEVAAARSTYAYINYLEHGYVNGLDNFSKSMFFALAEKLGKAGFSTAERAALKASEFNPTSSVKGAAFTAYLAAHPLRQAIVQSHQGVRMLAYNPTGWATGGVEKHLGQFLGMKSGALQNPSAEAVAFTKFVDYSGLMSSVDKQNLIRGTLLDAADNANSVFRAPNKVAHALRKVGFDMGEQGNMLMHIASVFDKYKREGKNVLDKYVQGEMHSELRALSYDMNRAGDMPYNHTGLAAVLQFMQVPHKAMLQMTNRRIDPAMRGRMFVSDTLLWGVPGAAAASYYWFGGDILPEDKTQRDLILHGAESVILNEYLRQNYSDTIDIDFGSFNPRDTTGWGKFLTDVMVEGPTTVLLNSPAGQLFAGGPGNDSQITKAAKTAARFFGMQEDLDETPETAASVVHEVLKIAKGYDAAVKAHIALETGKYYDKNHILIKDNMHPIESALLAVGLPPSNQRDLYAASSRAVANTKEHKDEVVKTYKMIKQYYNEQASVEGNDFFFTTKVTSFILRKYKQDPVAQKIIQEQMAMDFKNPQDKLLSTLLKATELPNAVKLRDTIEGMPLPEEQRKQLLQRVDDFEKLRSQKGK